MTNEQAIEVLNDIHLQCCDASSIFNTLDWEYRCKALDMAIEALEQESCSDLCKSCDAKWCIFQSGIKREKCDFYHKKEESSKQKKGEWIWDDEMGCFICSNCEQGWKEQPTLMGKPLFDWCPVCGSDNRGEQDDKD